MSVCLIVSSSRDTNLLSLAAQFASVQDTSLIVLEALRRRGETSVGEATPADSGAAVSIEVVNQAVERFEKERHELLARTGKEDVDQSAEEEFSPLEVRFERLFAEKLDEEVLEYLRNENVRLLLLPCSRGAAGTSESIEEQLFNRSHSETIYLRVPEEPLSLCRQILVPTIQGGNSRVALRHSSHLAGAFEGSVTALYVEPEVDDVAEFVGYKILDKEVGQVVGIDAERIRRRVRVSNDFFDGVRSALRPEDQLVLVGAFQRRRTTRLVHGILADGPDQPVVGAVRAAVPFASRMRQFVERQLRDRVPQLGREQRVSLVERVQSSSQWDFDFTSLICLSTLIAALGLVLNSGAVVIGAMLVAPLMTPLVGGGLSLVQGNLVLAKTAAKSVIKGFVLAFVIAYLLGWCIVDLHPTAEMKARTAPSVIDLIVAFVSGMAAAYAMGRPNLTSALPGVAIAAALVPPIASSAMYASLGQWGLSYGALLLFVTNIVAIVLATALLLWLVGIRDTHQHGTARRWSKRAVIGFSVLMVALVVYESWPSLPTRLRADLVLAIAEEQGRVRSIQRQPRTKPARIVVAVESAHDNQADLARKLLKVAEEHLETAEIEIEWHLIHRSE